jgi:hypothetical protein
MRTLTALALTAAIGMGASLYTPAAKAGGVYVGVGLPAPVIAGCVAPGYYGPVCAGPYIGYAGGWGGYGYGGRYWGRGPGFYGHPGYFGGGHFAGGHVGGGHWGGGGGFHGGHR